MKKFGIAFFIGLFSINLSYSQSSDSIYHIRILIEDTGEPLPFVNLTVSENGVVIGGGTSDINGIVKIVNPQFQISKQTNVKVTCVGYSTRELIGLSLTLNDTLDIVMKLNYYNFESIDIIYYCVPLVDKDPEDLSKKEKRKLAETPYIDSSLIYSTNILAKYDSIVNGTWFRYEGGGEIVVSYFREYIYSRIQYPEHARAYCIEETIYFSFTVDAEGYVKNIALRKGTCPALVIEVAKALRGISRIVFEDGYKQNSTTFILPVRFVLQ